MSCAFSDHVNNLCREQRICGNEEEIKLSKIKLEMGKLGLPNVFGKIVFDEFIVVVLVKAPKDSEIADFKAHFEVEHHRVALLHFHAHEKKEGGAVRV